ncbi:MAG TPA: SDR family NAD(P)-dependent oxidoreductase, partial [bacterium]|nr:SDR family NAD(P)-dependent oxidoreductase [bacterium]
MILDRFRLDDRVAVVTGAGRGLGQGIAVGLAEAGADLVAVDIIELQETRRQIENMGRRCTAVVADLGKESSVQQIIDAALAAFGRIDILVNNAGIIRRAPFLEFSLRDWDEVMDINIRAVFLLSQAAARVMAAAGRGGKIINIASMLSFQGGVRVPSYTASKSAVMGFVASHDGDHEV